MQTPTTYEEASLALNQFRERRLTERRSTPRASADRRGTPTAQTSDVAEGDANQAGNLTEATSASTAE